MRTITNPATSSSLSSSVIRNELQLLENEIGTTVREETPAASGGSTTVFTLAHTPIANTLQLFRGGSRITVGSSDYTIASATITLTTPLGAGETLTADYSW